MSARPIDTILTALERAGCKLTKDGDGWRTSCPSPRHPHGNRKNPALSISEGADGRALLCCHAGCGVDDVLGALGLEPAALFPDGGDKTPRAPKKPARGEQKPRYLPGEPVGKDGVTRFPYRDADGRTVIYVRRIEEGDPDPETGKRAKTFRQYHHDGKGWLAGLGPWKERPRPLFRLPFILKHPDAPVVMHEGEKAALAALKARLDGEHTCTIGGAGNAHKSDFTALAGRVVFIVPDADEAGEKHARQVAELAHEAGAAKVAIVTLPDVPPKGDVVEWLEAGGTPEAWRDLLAKAQPFTAEEKAADGDLVSLADVKPERIEWLWPGRIAIGKLTMFAGDPGLGKSLLTAELAAHVTRGRPWPVDGTPCPKGAVLMLSAEDDLADTIRPRLDAAGADPARVFALPMVRDVDAESRERRRVPSLVGDLERIEAMLMRRPEIRLVTIDPVSAYLAGVDSHKNTDMRAVLAPWADMAARRRVALVCVSHLNKGSGQAIYRTAGSIAFTAAARAVFGVTKDAEDEARRLVVPVKNNLGKDSGGLAYRVREGDNGAPHIEWEPEPIHISADEAMTRRSDDEHRTATDEAVDFLREVLADGPVKAKDVHREARNAGIGDKALRRARERLGIKPRKQGGHFGKNAQCWVWSLPDDDPLKMPSKTEDAPSVERASSGERGIFSEDAAPEDPFADGLDNPDFLPPDADQVEVRL